MVSPEGPIFIPLTESTPGLSWRDQLSECQNGLYPTRVVTSFRTQAGEVAHVGPDQPLVVRLHCQTNEPHYTTHFGKPIRETHRDTRANTRTILYPKRPYALDRREVLLTNHRHWMDSSNLWLTGMALSLTTQLERKLTTQASVLGAGSVGLEAEMAYPFWTPSDLDGFVIVDPNTYDSVQTDLTRESPLKSALIEAAEQALAFGRVRLGRASPRVCDFFLFDGVDPKNALLMRFKHS